MILSDISKQHQAPPQSTLLFRISGLGSMVVSHSKQVVGSIPGLSVWSFCSVRGHSVHPDMPAIPADIGQKAGYTLTLRNKP